jgi:2-oxoglutarate ferredoxin oxidoreductase subunit alpha
MTKIFIMGNVAAAMSAMKNGLEFYGGYPITPSTEALEYLAEVMPPERFINAFSELETINLLYGFGSAGKRCMTATSGCGLSLMREGLSYAIGAKVPMVIYDVMRYGPGLGGITPSTEDINVVWGAGHGQSKIPVLTPSTVGEISDCMMYAFDIADALRIPVLVMCDATLGQMYEPVEIHKSDFTFNKHWSVGKHTHNVTSSRRTTNKVVMSYKTYESEMHEQTEFILNREKEMYSICKVFMPETVKVKHNENGKYICSIGTTARVIQEVAEKTDMGYIVPLLLNPFEFKDKEKIKELTVVEIGGTGLYDIMKYHFPNAKIKSIVFSCAIPNSEEIMERL